MHKQNEKEKRKGGKWEDIYAGLYLLSKQVF